MAPKASVQTNMSVQWWISVKCKCLWLFLSCGMLLLAPLVAHMHFFHAGLSSLCAQLLQSKHTSFFPFSLLYVCLLTVKCSRRNILKHTRTASYTAVIVDCKFMAQSSIPRVLGPMKYPPPPTISPLQSAKTPAEWGLGDAEVSYFLQSSCGEVTSCSVVILSLPTQPIPE